MCVYVYVRVSFCICSTHTCTPLSDEHSLTQERAQEEVLQHVPAIFPMASFEPEKVSCLKWYAQNGMHGIVNVYRNGKMATLGSKSRDEARTVMQQAAAAIRHTARVCAERHLSARCTVVQK